MLKPTAKPVAKDNIINARFSANFRSPSNRLYECREYCLLLKRVACKQHSRQIAGIAAKE